MFDLNDITGLLVLLPLMASMIHLFTSTLKNRSPTQILIDIIAIKVRKEWDRIKGNPVHIPIWSALGAGTAMDYLNERDAGIRILKYENSNRVWSSSKNTPKDEGDVVSTIVLTAVLALIAAAFLAGIVALILALPRIFAIALEHSTELILLVFFWALMSYAIRSVSSKSLQELVPVTGLVDQWLAQQAATHEAIREDRHGVFLILNQMSPENREKAMSYAKDRDPDTVDARNTPTPIPPGIAEIALSAGEEALTDIRSNLHHLRRFHHRLAVGTVSLFFAALIISLGSVAFGDATYYRAAFGSLSVGAVLGTFAFFTLRNLRIAHISLALFESFIAELKANLSDSEALGTMESRTEGRAKAWKQFRRGLNDLWASERKTREK